MSANSAVSLPSDPSWPRAAHWLAAGRLPAELVVLGVPAHTTSISPTNAHLTPAAIRESLLRYSTHHMEFDVDLRNLAVFDAGDVENPDNEDGEARVAKSIDELNLKNELLCALGGDNSITFSVMKALFNNDLANAGLLTLDAHFDLRDGISNGSPVQRLIESGLNPKNIVQIGINDFSNSPEYAQRAKDYGITVIPRSALRNSNIKEVVKSSLASLAQKTIGIYVDIDVDVCDRSFVPACPASAPGGITADELRQAAQVIGAHMSVKGFDITEIDAAKDSDDQRTIRLGALCVLEAAAGRLSAISR